MKERLKFQTTIDASIHDEFVKNHPLSHLLQSSTWGKVKENWGSKIVGVVDETGKLVASSLVLIKRLPLGFTMLYLPRGPILDYANAELVEFFFEQLKRWAKQKRALFVKIDPAVILREFRFGEESPVEMNPEAVQAIEHLKMAGAKHVGFTKKMSGTIQPRFQANKRLSSSMDKDYSKHVRRDQKNAIKCGVVGRRVGAEFLPAFCEVIQKTESRQGISLRSQRYFERLMNLYKENAFLYLAEIHLKEKYFELEKRLLQIEQELKETPENQKKRIHRLNEQKVSVEKFLAEFREYDLEQNELTVVAGILMIRFSQTVEILYAGMNEDFKRLYPQYLLYPQIFEAAFDDGVKWANMGGIEGSFDDRLSKFKSNFNPEIQEFIGEFNLPVNRLLYGLSNFAFSLRKKMRERE